MKLEIIGGDHRFVMCHSGYYLEVERSRRPFRRLLRKMMVIVASKIVKNGGILDVFWNTGTGFADRYKMLKENYAKFSNWMDRSVISDMKMTIF